MDDEDVVGTQPYQKGFGDSDLDVAEWDPSDVKIYVPDLASRTGYYTYWVRRRHVKMPPHGPTGFRPRP